MLDRIVLLYAVDLKGNKPTSKEDAFASYFRLLDANLKVFL